VWRNSHSCPDQDLPAVQQSLLSGRFRLSAITLVLCDSFGSIAATNSWNWGRRFMAMRLARVPRGPKPLRATTRENISDKG
jgi:hypothetical protein